MPPGGVARDRASGGIGDGASRGINMVSGIYAKILLRSRGVVCRHVWKKSVVDTSFVRNKGHTKKERDSFPPPPLVGAEGRTRIPEDFEMRNICDVE